MSRRPRTSPSTYRRGRAVLAAATGVACAAALAVAPASAAIEDSGDRGGLPVLKGFVGPGFTISIDDDSVPAGRYKLVVKDQGTIHNFHITGAGVDKATSLPGTGRTKFRIRLKVGTYEIVCDNHASMNTTLTVT